MRKLTERITRPPEVRGNPQSGEADVIEIENLWFGTHLVICYRFTYGGNRKSVLAVEGETGKTLHMWRNW